MLLLLRIVINSSDGMWKAIVTQEKGQNTESSLENLYYNSQLNITNSKDITETKQIIPVYITARRIIQYLN